MKKGLRQVSFIIILLVIWEIFARTGWYPKVLFPTIMDILKAFIHQREEILMRSCSSLSMIFKGLSIAMVVAFIVSGLSVFSKNFFEGVATLMGIMHPLPGIALLPVTLLWFGTGIKSIIAIITFSSLWPLIANIYNGLRSVPQTQLEVGINMGLNRVGLIRHVMLPAALPNILTGLRIGWARAWQASVAAEMVFGASGNEGGIGWFLFKMRYLMQIPEVFSGLIVIVIIGVIMENVVIASIENITIRKWRLTNDNS